MDIRFIKLVTAIVEKGSLSLAADYLHLTQSALSHQLKEFENTSGTLFFTRSNKRLNITPAGQLVYESARTILSEISKLETQLKNLNQTTRGVIRISAGCTTSYHWLPPILTTFNEQYPNVSVEIKLDATGNPLPEITNGNLDIALINTPIENKNIEYISLFEDEMVAVISNNHPWATKPYVIAKDFADQHLIIHSKPLATVPVYAKVLKPKGIEPTRISELPLTEATIELIKANYGITVMSRWSLKNYIEKKEITIKRINKQGLFRQHYIAIPKGIKLPDYINKFVAYIKEEMTQSLQNNSGDTP